MFVNLLRERLEAEKTAVAQLESEWTDPRQAAEDRMVAAFKAYEEALAAEREATKASAVLDFRSNLAYAVYRRHAAIESVNTLEKMDKHDEITMASYEADDERDRLEALANEAFDAFCAAADECEQAYQVPGEVPDAIAAGRKRIAELTLKVGALEALENASNKRKATAEALRNAEAELDRLRLNYAAEKAYGAPPHRLSILAENLEAVRLAALRAMKADQAAALEIVTSLGMVKLNDPEAFPKPSAESMDTLAELMAGSGSVPGGLGTALGIGNGQGMPSVLGPGRYHVIPVGRAGIPPFPGPDFFRNLGEALNEFRGGGRPS